MFVIRFLAVLPFIGILGGAPFLNRVTPLVFGLPLLFAWLLLWIVLTSVIMLVIYLCDPANRATPPGPGHAHERSPHHHRPHRPGRAPARPARPGRHGT